MTTGRINQVSISVVATRPKGRASTKPALVATEVAFRRACWFAKSNLDGLPSFPFDGEKTRFTDTSQARLRTARCEHGTELHDVPQADLSFRSNTTLAPVSEPT